MLSKPQVLEQSLFLLKAREAPLIQTVFTARKDVWCLKVVFSWCTIRL